MKINKIRIGTISVPLKVPFKTALRTVTSVEDIIVELHTDTGDVGYGEAPPTGVITGDTKGGIISAITDHISKVVLGRDIEDLESILLDIQSSCVHNNSAKAAVDMAIYDLFGKRFNIPTFQMLGGARENLITDITISVNSPEEMAEDAKVALSRGYDCLKIKVGKDPSLDIKRLKAVRDAVGEKTTIRIDANQGWSRKGSVKMLSIMDSEGLNIEFCEQPVKGEDFEGMKYVTEHSPIPILADESVFSPEDALKIMQMGAADMVNIKLMKCGGLYNGLKIAQMAEIYGVECMIGCMLEAKVSVNAAIHLACAKSIITKIDLDGPVLCSEDPVIGGSVFNEKEIVVSKEAGLGITGIEKIEYLNLIR